MPDVDFKDDIDVLLDNLEEINVNLPVDQQSMFEEILLLTGMPQANFQSIYNRGDYSTQDHKNEIRKTVELFLEKVTRTVFNDLWDKIMQKFNDLELDPLYLGHTGTAKATSYYNRQEYLSNAILDRFSSNYIERRVNKISNASKSDVILIKFIINHLSNTDLDDWNRENIGWDEIEEIQEIDKEFEDIDPTDINLVLSIYGLTVYDHDSEYGFDLEPIKYLASRFDNNRITFSKYLLELDEKIKKKKKIKITKQKRKTRNPRLKMVIETMYDMQKDVIDLNKLASMLAWTEGAVRVKEFIESHEEFNDIGTLFEDDMFELKRNKWFFNSILKRKLGRIAQVLGYFVAALAGILFS